MCGTCFSFSRIILILYTYIGLLSRVFPKNFLKFFQKVGLLYFECGFLLSRVGDGVVVAVRLIGKSRDDEMPPAVRKKNLHREPLDTPPKCVPDVMKQFQPCELLMVEIPVDRKPVKLRGQFRNCHVFRLLIAVVTSAAGHWIKAGR